MIQVETNWGWYAKKHFPRFITQLYLGVRSNLRANLVKEGWKVIGQAENFAASFRVNNFACFA